MIPNALKGKMLHARGFLADVEQELAKAMASHDPLSSDHEAYAVLLEEVDEYWEEVKRKQSSRDRLAMRKELIQVAAMAVRALVDLDYPHLPPA